MIKKIMMKYYYPIDDKKEANEEISELQPSEALQLLKGLQPFKEIDGTLCQLYTCPRCGREFYLDSAFDFFMPPTCGKCN